MRGVLDGAAPANHHVGKFTTFSVSLMEEPVSAAEANRNFSQILRNVKEGHSYVVTSHGTPVARIVPTKRGGALSDAAKATLMARLRAQPVQIVGHRWSRDDLYED
ncbi:type II toxin-antitoxin system Phd/YefM family antitoxin [Azospirillum isscasi]|uniref:Antitoxin n=1 Tax=Azospirillum isscasi TaxID=3053926 RepID=A0ABU0WH47_9PROT|nr:type II toxin-antitoxin system prevent-host-death family antitoxin [Azospirillum isscasi]MDQ2103528.1 type II toxin-antitoxin system prevent-host-death family antitoxin [Azospirillum isscasi]